MPWCGETRDERGVTIGCVNLGSRSCGTHDFRVPRVRPRYAMGRGRRRLRMAGAAPIIFAP